MSGPTSFDIRGERYFGGPRSASKKLDHAKRAAARRRILPGFPISTPFKKPQDVWDYLNGDRITCLRCGQSYKALPTHLPIHGWTAAKYQEFYGLPWGTGLTSSGTKSLKHKNGTRLFEEGVAFGKPPAFGAARPIISVQPNSQLAGFDQFTIHRRRLPGGNPGGYQEKLKAVAVMNVTRVLDRMEAHDRALVDVCIDPDMPGQTAVYEFVRARPDFKRAFEACWERRSFRVQAAAERLGKRFKTEASKLRRGGMTNKEIGRTFGVHWITVAKYLSGVPIPEKTHCFRGHPYPVNGPKHCEICETALRRIRRGEMSRSESAKVQIIVPCFVCGEPVKRSRLRGKKPQGPLSQVLFGLSSTL